MIGKCLTILIPAVFFVGMAAGGDLKKSKPLRDGFLLAGVDGSLSGEDSNDLWYFEFDSDVNDGEGRIIAGQSVELLRSAGLEKLIINAKKYPDATYRLWGRITRYKGSNFIFPTYFLSLRKVKRIEQLTAEESQQKKGSLTINDPNDPLAIPDDVIKKLAVKRIIRMEQLEEKMASGQDAVLIDRAGFISLCVNRGTKVQRRKGAELTQYEFVPDALGRNIQKISFGLLGCEALERAVRKQAGEPEPVRFEAAGIVTKYKDNYYLLLQRARPVYSYGNFGR